jgi:hypothetical protein
LKKRPQPLRCRNCRARRRRGINKAKVTLKQHYVDVEEETKVADLKNLPDAQAFTEC